MVARQVDYVNLNAGYFYQFGPNSRWKSQVRLYGHFVRHKSSAFGHKLILFTKTACLTFAHLASGGIFDHGCSALTGLPCRIDEKCADVNLKHVNPPQTHTHPTTSTSDQQPLIVCLVNMIYMRCLRLASVTLWFDFFFFNTHTYICRCDQHH